MSSNAERLTEGVELPVLPSILAKMVQLNPDAANYFDELVELAESDPLFAVRALRLAGSARYARRAQPRSIRGAIAVLGSQTTRQLLVSFAITQVFVPRTEEECSLWLHSLQVADAARLVAELMTEDIEPSEAYLAGLLHDLGRFVFLQQSAEKLHGLFEDLWCGSGGALEAEVKAFGVDHAELGAALATRWELPDRIRATIEVHHSEDLSSLDRETRALVTVVQVADRISLGLLRSEEDAPDRAETIARESELQHIRGCPRARVLTPLVLKVEEQAVEQAAALGIR
jgi:putative nucleotidyltransferase with HDIG domain